MASQSLMHQRLLKDIAEIQSDPYPGIDFHIRDSLDTACLILFPEGSEPLHLTMSMSNYPLQPPSIEIQSRIRHPNIYGSYVCASILNTREGYTPAYTLRSIAIQMLSFFSSDSLEQDYGGVVDLAAYRSGPGHARHRVYSDHKHPVRCGTCGFDEIAMSALPPGYFGENAQRANGKLVTDHEQAGQSARALNVVKPISPLLTSLPDEILLLIFSSLDTHDLNALAQAYPRARIILNSYDFIRMRELQCFCVKGSFLNFRLGVGMNIQMRGKEGTLKSEFDLLSYEAFHQHGVRQSVQGLPFELWIPLAISRRHYRSIQPLLPECFDKISDAARLADSTPFTVLSRFLNDIVVSFSQQAESSFANDGPRSTLAHASEKAVEAYFTIFHLLLCQATEYPDMVRAANRTIRQFLEGKTSKISCPNLGTLLVATLINDEGLTQDLALATIREAILRNVVWMLDRRGANMPELSYLEPSEVSEYRLHKTFQASLVSYRLLMFCSLFCRTARNDAAGKGLSTIRDEMFDRHGAPPPGVAEQMAQEIRRIKTIDNFASFLLEMGVQPQDMPKKSQFTTFLREMVPQSERVGYSRMPLDQASAYSLRVLKEPAVEVKGGFTYNPHLVLQWHSAPKSFFPSKGENMSGRPGSGRAGRGRIESRRVGRGRGMGGRAWAGRGGRGRGGRGGGGP